MNLLDRSKFRKQVFERDLFKCVVCGDPAVDAHHIMERRLFSDGGYYLDNGASVCEKHHLEAEKTVISPQELRDLIGVSNLILPEHLYPDYEYDKWGNIMLSNGNRLRGELFYDESVQKILKAGEVLDLFVKYVKYPRTYHLPWSQPGRKDDKYLRGLSHFEGKRIVVTEKMDGENTSIYRDHIHARSIDSKSHPSRNWVKGLYGKIAWELPEGWRICGENLYAKHTVSYDNLESYFLAFSMWNEKNICLSWRETLEYLDILELKSVPVIYDGIFDEKYLRELSKKFDGLEKEGYVVRLAEEFTYGNFRNSVAKFVGSGFILPHGHWMRNKLIPNKLSFKNEDIQN